MAKVLPDPMVLPALGEALPGKNVQYTTWQDAGNALNRIWARRGWRVQGPVFEEPWQTASTSYVTANSATDPHYDLDDWQGMFRFTRRIYDAVDTEDAYQIRLDTFGRNLDVRASLTRFDTEDGLSSSSTTGQTLVTSHDDDSDWQNATLTRDPDEAARNGVSSGGLAYWVVHVEAKVPVTGTGYLWSWALRESPITAGANLPRGL